MGFLSGALSNVAKRWHPAKWPSSGSNLERWLITGKYNDSSYTGKSIDEETAMSATAVWSAVSQLSQALASLPLHLYRRLARGKERAIKHRLYKLIHLKPNLYMGSMSFREQQMGQVLRYGTCYAEKELNGAGEIIGLWPLLSKNIRQDILFGKDLVYIITLPNGGEKVLDSSRILRINGFSPNGICGYNPIELGKESIGLSLAIEEYGSRFFGNGARPGAVLEHPGSVSQEAQDRLRSAWKNIHEGLENAHRLAILEEGMKLHEYETNAEDSQTLETRVFQVSEIARIFNMPLHMLKELTKSTNNNIEHQGQEFLTYCLRFWLVKFEQEYTIQLLSEKEHDEYFFEHLVDALLRGNSQARHTAYASGRQWGYYSANDVLEMENKNSIGAQGDIYVVPLNMIPADQVLNKLKEEPKEEIDNIKTIRLLEIRERLFNSYNILFLDVFQKLINRECIAIGRQLKKFNNDEFKTWLNTFYIELKDIVFKGLYGIIRNYSEQIFNQLSNELILINPDFNCIDKTVNDFSTIFSNEYIDKHYKRFLSMCDCDDSLSKLEIELKDIEQSSIKYKYSTNINLRVLNTICHFVFDKYGYRSKWHKRNNACDKCKSLDNQYVCDSNFNDVCCCFITL